VQNQNYCILLIQFSCPYPWEYLQKQCTPSSQLSRLGSGLLCIKYVVSKPCKRGGWEKWAQKGREGVGVCKILERLSVPKNLISSHCWKLVNVCRNFSKQSPVDRTLLRARRCPSWKSCWPQLSCLQFPRKSWVLPCWSCLSGPRVQLPLPAAAAVAMLAWEGHLPKTGTAVRLGQLLCFKD